MTACRPRRCRPTSAAWARTGPAPAPDRAAPNASMSSPRRPWPARSTGQKCCSASAGTPSTTPPSPRSSVTVSAPSSTMNDRRTGRCSRCRWRSASTTVRCTGRVRMWCWQTPWTRPRSSWSAAPCAVGFWWTITAGRRASSWKTCRPARSGASPPAGWSSRPMHCGPHNCCGPPVFGRRRWVDTSTTNPR